MAQRAEPGRRPARGAPAGGELGRRAALASALALLPVALAGRRAASARPPASSFPTGATMLVAGPSGGALDQYASALLPALARSLPAGTDLRRNAAGGPDGVTGANQFEARGDPDGASVLMLPGEATLAWLIGDPRARFDAGRLLPVLAGVAPGVLMSRLPPEALAAGTTVRLAGFRPGDAALVGLLALELLGLRPQPAFGFADAAAVEGAIAGGAADAVFVVGPDAPERVAGLARLGLSPLLALGGPARPGAPVGANPRDAWLAEVPALPELATRLRGAPPSGPLYDAWRATAAATRLTFLLALPALTPSALVALWRQVAIQAAPLVAAPPGAPPLRMLTCPDANRATEPLAAADVTALFELRRWLADRINWQPA